MDDFSLFMRFGTALVIGLLIGLQREFAKEKLNREILAGVRTFSLLGLLGCAAAMICEQLQSPLPFIAVILTVGFLITAHYAIKAWRENAGMTTEVTILLTVLIGALVFWNHLNTAIALGIATTFLLAIKFEAHRLARKITQDDFFAVLKFAAITAIVLPILPNKVYGPAPFDIFNPYKIWLLVVLISGIGFVGYVLIKLIGARKGIGLVGFLGGLVSSTAVTLSMTQRSKATPELAPTFAFAMIVAWTVMYYRMVAIVAAVNSSLANQLWLPLSLPAVIGMVYGLVLLRSQGAQSQEHISFTNPFELGPALQFGLIFSVILALAKAAQVYWGSTGIYFASFVSGLADVDAISISLAKFAREANGIDLKIALKAIVLASLANTLTKSSIVLIVGPKALRRVILPGIILVTAGAILAIFLI